MVEVLIQLTATQQVMVAEVVEQGAVLFPDLVPRPVILRLGDSLSVLVVAAFPLQSGEVRNNLRVFHQVPAVDSSGCCLVAVLQLALSSVRLRDCYQLSVRIDGVAVLVADDGTHFGQESVTLCEVVSRRVGLAEFAHGVVGTGYLQDVVLR